GPQGRIGDAATIIMTGGLLSFIGNAASASTELVGALTLNAAASFINTIQSTAGAVGQNLTFLGTLTRNAGSDVNFVGSGSALAPANNKIFLTGVNEIQAFVLTVDQSSTLSGSFALTLTTGAASFNINPTDSLATIQGDIDAGWGAGVGTVSALFNN